MKKILVMLLLLILIPLSSAVIINQVLVDPINTDSGGEAIELYNPLNQNVDISGWTIETAKSQVDVLFPKETLILPKKYFLIADNGWNESKDNNEWKNADFYDTITLKNQDSVIILKDNKGNIVDELSWGESSALTNPKAGKAFLRTQNNFIITDPAFFLNQVFIQVNIGYELNINISDDSTNPGIQIKPFAGEIREISFVVDDFSDIFFNGENIKVQQVNGSYIGKLQIPYYLLPGNYTLLVDKKESIIEILPIKDFSILTSSLAFKSTKEKAIVGMKNTGNTQIDLQLKIPLLKGEEEIYPKINPDKITLFPGEEKNVQISITVPTAKPGVYTGVVVFDIK
ncbi:lamin tail domain-containing protein [Candidatus Woesearchaeota archaeon]|nr:lamin tail domain-containing protein [Candidatus Woesearchaeota archaeon]